ncbi:polysaccharide biosynthesis C-terminal domain-containing protein [Mycolicibacterium sp. Y3]
MVITLLGWTVGVLPQIANPAGAALFSITCVCFAVGQVIDYVSVSDHRSGILLVRNLIQCGIRIPLIFASVSVLTEADSILLAWAVASGLSLVWAFVAYGSRAGRALRPSFRNIGRHLGEMASALAGQHLITVSAMLAGYVLPVIVYSRLSAAENAYFYTTWMLGSVFFIVSPAVSASLFVEGAACPTDLRPLARRCVVTIMVLMVPPILVYVLAGRSILGLFGRDFADHGYLLLLLLAISAVPDAVTNVAISILRVTGRIRTAMLLNAGMLLGCLGVAWFIAPLWGIEGVGAAWIISQLAGAIWVVLCWKRISDPATVVDEQAAFLAVADTAALGADGGSR